MIVFWGVLTAWRKKSVFQLRLPVCNLGVSLSLCCRELRRRHKTLLLNLSLKSDCIWQLKTWNSNASSVKRNFRCLDNEYPDECIENAGDWEFTDPRLDFTSSNYLVCQFREITLVP